MIGNDWSDVRRAVDALYEAFDHYTWVGVYVVHGDELAPGPSRGDTAPGGTELVVPILSGDETIGEIHVESDRPQAFGPADRAFLEHVARLIAPAARAEVLSRD